MKYNLYIIAILFAATLTSCKKFVEIGPPKTSLVTETVFEDNNTATAAVTVIYSRMAGAETYNLPLQTGLYGDELRNWSTGMTAYYQNAVDANNNVPSAY